MANIPFLLEYKFNLNPLLQETFHSPPLRTLSYGGNNALKLNYSSCKVIKYSPKLRIKCFSMSPKPKGENGIDGNGYREDKELKAVAISSGINEVLWRSTQIVLKALQFHVITGILLGLLFLYDHHHGCVALAATGGRMGGSSFSSSSSSRSTKSSTSSSSSSRASSSSSSSRPKSSSSSSSSRPKSSPSSSSSYPKSSSSSSYSSPSSQKSSSSSSWSSPSSQKSSSSSWKSSTSRRPSSSWSSSSSESPKSSDSSWWSSPSESPKSSSSPSAPLKGHGNDPAVEVESAVENGQTVAVKPAVGVKPAVRVNPFIACTMIVLGVGLVATILSHTVFAEKAKSISRTVLVEKTSVLKLQVGLSGMGRPLQKELNQIAETADSSSPEGFYNILQDTIGALLRHPEHCISGYSSVDAKRNIEEVETLFSQHCIEERAKIDEETLVNVNNRRMQSATTQKSNEFSNEYIVITIIVAAEGAHQLPPINSSSNLKEALQKLKTITSEKIKAVEVLWTPQNENDILTEQEYLEDYSLLRPLSPHC